MYKTIDLFAGIGGIRLGFEQAFGNDVSNVFTSEVNKFSNATYAANFTTKIIYGDITKISEEEIPAFDICMAGFPCQAFSMGGKRLGFNDNYYGVCRGTLFREVVRICKFHKPKVVFLENVKGLLTHDSGNTFNVIVKALEEIGYKIYYQVLNSNNFGVAQRRERVYIVAFREDIVSNNFKFPVGSNTAGNCIMNILENAPIPSKYYLSDTYLDFLIKHKERHTDGGYGYVIRKLDDITGTLVCGGMGREKNLIIDEREHSLTPTTHIKGNINNKSIRNLTPREWARLQGFPDTYKIVVSDTQAYKQFGNTVTVPVIKAIATEIKKILE